MATHATHKSESRGKTRTETFKLTRKTKSIETALADRALARLMREVNGSTNGAG